MSDPLSVALFSHIASPLAPTGAERSLALLAAGLRTRGHRVSVAAPGRASVLAELGKRGVTVRTVPCRSCWLTYHDPRPWPAVALRWLRFASPQRAVSRLRAFVEECRVDVVHVNCLPHVRGARAGFEARRPVVWHVREILPPGGRRRWFAAQLRRYATAIVAVSEATADWIRDEGLEDRLHVVPNGVRIPDRLPSTNGSRADLGIPPDGIAVGLFGQLVLHKGALEFIAAACRAGAVAPDLRFVIAGGGPERFRARVAVAIEESGIAERFHLLPPQSGADRLIAACDVISLATLTPDPFPRAVLEAMAAGKPVAAYRSGGTAEMVVDGETGFLVPPGDVDGLARAFERLSRDRTLRETLGRAAARRVVEEFSLERHVDRMEGLFRSLCR